VSLELVTAGESHGPEVLAVLSGMPSGVLLNREALDRELARRQHGHGRGGRQKIERDRVQVRSGVRNGMTLGSPITLAIPNRDWENWQRIMDPWNVDPREAARRQITCPRPGHADLAGAWKWGHTSDLRNVLERASARETAARVAGGAVCRQLLSLCGIEIRSGVLALGGQVLHQGAPTWEVLGAVCEDSPLRTPTPQREAELVELVNRTKSDGETLGGVLGVVVRGVPPGLGSCAHWEERLDGLLAQAVMAVQAIKAVVVGSGMEAAALPGSQVHDPIEPGADGIRRTSNHCGGLEGGMTTGQDLVLRAFMKPIPTVRTGLPSMDLATGQPARSAYERSDVTAVPACGVIVEAAVAFVLARALLDSFGGGHVDDVLAALATFKRRLGNLGPEGFSPR